MFLPVPMGTEARLHGLPWMTVVLLVVNVLIAAVTSLAVPSGAEAVESELERLADWELDKAATASPELAAARRAHRTALGFLHSDPRWRQLVEDERALKRLESYLRDADEIRGSHLFHRFGLVPAELTPLRLITHQFLHADWLHLLFNMLFLWVVGSVLEATWGPWRLLAFHLVGGVAAAFAHVAAYPGDLEPAIGASGAVAALMGAFAVRHGRLKIRLALVLMATLVPRISFVSMPAWLFLGAWFLQQVGWWLLSQSSDLGVALEAHVGGFLWGALACFVAIRIAEGTGDGVGEPSPEERAS